MIARLICAIFGHDWYGDANMQVCGRCYRKVYFQDRNSDEA